MRVSRTAGSPRCAPLRSALETRLQALETQQQEDLAGLREEKEQLRRLLGSQSGALAGLERSLRIASSNSSLLQRRLLESLQRLVHVMAQGRGGRAAGERAGEWAGRARERRGEEAGTRRGKGPPVPTCVK